uniref:Uncharacterized protein n=1 Tax=Avena sativa TaxID=4498 RepID=A0ACD5U8W2_AVESA
MVPDSQPPAMDRRDDLLSGQTDAIACLDAGKESKAATPSPTPNSCHDQPAAGQGPAPEPTPEQAGPTAQSSAVPRTPVSRLRVAPHRYSTPPKTYQLCGARTSTTKPWTLGDFLKAATKHIDAVLPTPRKKTRRQPLNFSPRRGRSATATKQASAPPTAERRAQVQILCTLGLIELDQKITDVEMKAYDCMFAMPIPRTVLAAIAALVDRDLADTPAAPAVAVEVAGEA